MLLDRLWCRESGAEGSGSHQQSSGAAHQVKNVTRAGCGGVGLVMMGLVVISSPVVLLIR